MRHDPTDERHTGDSAAGSTSRRDPSRWRWVEPTVWTVRMVTTLEQGVEGGKWFRLFDKVFAERNLLAAFQQVASKHGAAGVDHVTVTQFERALPESLWEVLGPIEARHVSAPVDPSRSHPQAGHHRDSTAGYPHGARSNGPGGGGERDRTDLRAGLRGAQLRVPAGARRLTRPTSRILQGRTEGGYPTKTGLSTEQRRLRTPAW